MHQCIYVSTYAMYACTYMCTYVCIHASLYVSTYLCMHLCIYASMYLCIYVCMYVRTYVCMYVSMYLCIYASMYLCIYACMDVCIYVSMYLCIYVSMYLCIYVSMYLCIYVSVYMYILYIIYVYVCVCGTFPPSNRRPSSVLIHGPGGFEGFHQFHGAQELRVSRQAAEPGLRLRQHRSLDAHGLGSRQGLAQLRLAGGHGLGEGVFDVFLFSILCRFLHNNMCVRVQSLRVCARVCVCEFGCFKKRYMCLMCFCRSGSSKHLS